MDPVTTTFLIKAGFDTLSAWWRSRQEDKAAGREVDMSKEALALEKEMFERSLEYQRQQDDEDRRRNDRDFYERQRTGERDYADMSPYRNIGTGALSRLAFGVGIPDPGRSQRDTTVAPPPSPMQSWNTGEPMQPWDTNTMGPVPSLANLGQPQTANVSMGGMTTMRTPTGQTVMVPAAKVKEAIANGGTVLSGAA
jgi:hypothetical protein